jgi:hypothetical protein
MTCDTCDTCDIALTDDIHIFCLTHKTEGELVFCSECWHDLSDEMRKEGWRSDEDEDEKKPKDCGVCGFSSILALPCGNFNEDGVWVCQDCEEKDYETFNCSKCDRDFKSSDGEECPHCGYCPRLDCESNEEEAKCWWCNARGVDTKTETGVWIHADCG